MNREDLEAVDANVMRANRHHADAIADRLSLRPPQRHSLEILDTLTDLISLTKGDADASLSAVRAAFPHIADFERSFPNVCFALATGVGKTRLMGAFVAYLHIAHGINNFFVLAPNLTIYAKLISDFTPNTEKYVLKGISEFASTPPAIITGDNYTDRLTGGRDLFPVTINIFNISKIDAEVRNGRAPRIRSFREEIGESYFDYLSNLDDLVLIMDESHRYRASQGVRVLNELNPVLGLELTATPFTEDGRKTSRFANIIFEYPLASAMEDGFIKEPAVVTRDNFIATDHSPAAIQRIKLEDGIRLHENVKAELAAYSQQTGLPVVKPFILVIARDTGHAAELLTLIQSDDFFSGRYATKVIQIDSSTREDEMISRLLRVERADEPTEIVIHVNMLKEGWDVTNLYTIVPLRAASARVLIEQSIGRGLRLPYGQRTGVTAIDRLNIVAHDRFQEIVDEARKPGSAIRMRQMILTDADFKADLTTVSSPPVLHIRLGLPEHGTAPFAPNINPLFTDTEQRIAKAAYEAIQELGEDVTSFSDIAQLANDNFQTTIIEATKTKLDLGKADARDVARIVKATTGMVIDHSIAIPQISIHPRQTIRVNLTPFKLDASGLHFKAPADELWASHLRTGQIDRIVAAPDRATMPARYEDTIVSHLIAHDDMAYEDGSDTLYALAADAVAHLRSILSEGDLAKVLELHGRQIADNMRGQILTRSQPDGPADYVATVTRGFSDLKQSAYTAPANQPALDFRQPPPDKKSIARYIFCGFARCLYPLQKFQSDPERVLSIILDRDSAKWFRPAIGQFAISYRDGHDVSDYQPDFVAETENDLFILEAKAENEMDAPDVLAKSDAAVQWCAHASRYTATTGGKPWSYILIPHLAVTENMTLDGLVSRFSRR